jgi:hypothetical protein
MLDVLHPNPDAIDIDDIAHALSQTCRFRGMAWRYYSVAQHCCNVAAVLEHSFPSCREIHLAGLLHDAAEAYLGDMPTPIKDHFPEFKVPYPCNVAVCWADCVMLHVEGRRLVGDDFRPEPVPVGVDIASWSFVEAAQEFLVRFRKYTV